MMSPAPQRRRQDNNIGQHAISLTNQMPVIIIDADMRRPRMHKVFKVSNTTGLSSFLSGNEEFSESLIRHTGYRARHHAFRAASAEPAELLSSYGYAT